MSDQRELPAFLLSPGEAISHQRVDEARLGAALVRSTETMLLGVRRLAFNRELTVARAQELWLDAVHLAVGELTILDGDARQYLADGLLEADLGQEAYQSAMLVMRATAETYPAPSDKDVVAALDIALDLGSASLVASAADILGDARRVGLTWRNRIRRASRTGFTGFFGRVSQGLLRNVGIPDKMWVTRHDDKVRESHAAADGQVQKIDVPFIVGGARLMYPGDRTGPYEEIVSCRCVIVGRRT